MTKQDFPCFEAQNIAYWSQRASGYSQVNQEELQSNQNTIWGDTLEKCIQKHHIGQKKADVRVLDIGTGPGFFAILLAEKGYSVTAIDYTESMLAEAKSNAGSLAKAIHFLRMNAEELIFENNSFDVIVTRNLTWNLHHPQAAYREWHRVLAPGGVLLNFDANWYSYLYDDKAYDGYLQDRNNIKVAGVKNETDGTDIAAMEAIAYQNPLSSEHRPDWDKKFLSNLGMHVTVDKDIWKTLWTLEEKINNASTPMFLVHAIK